MQKKLMFTAALVAIGTLSACAQQQQEEVVAPVMPEPVYNKYGHIDHGDHTHAPHNWSEHHHNTLTGDPDTLD